MISIERTLSTGYEDKEYDVKDAINVLNLEIENGRSIWLDGNLFDGSVVDEEVLLNHKRVCVTNKLTGG